MEKPDPFPIKTTSATGQDAMAVPHVQDVDGQRTLVDAYGSPTLSIPADVQLAIDKALRVSLTDVVQELERVIRQAAIYSHKDSPKKLGD